MHSKLTLSKKQLAWLSAVVIFGVAFTLRFYQLGRVPVSLYWDEVAMLVDAKTIAANGKDMHGVSWMQALFPSYGDYKQPVYIWLASLSVKAFGPTELALRLPSALAGMGTVLVVGLMAYELSLLSDIAKRDRAITLGLFASGLMAITPWSIIFSRTGFEAHLGQFFAAVSIYLALKSARSKKLLIPAVVLGALATYTYFSVRFVWPVVFSYFTLLAAWTKLSSKLDSKQSVFKQAKMIWQTVAVLLAALVLYVVLLIPMFRSPWYQASNQFRLSASSILNSFDYAILSNQLRQEAGNNSVDRVLFHRHLLMLIELVKNYSDNLHPNFLFVTGDPNLRHGTKAHGLLLLPFLPLLVAGLLTLLKSQKSILLGLVGWWMLALLPASVPETTPHALRSLNALVPVVLLTGFGCQALFSWLLDQVQKGSAVQRTLAQSMRAALMGSIGIAALGFATHYFWVYPSVSANDWQDGYKQLAAYIEQEKGEVQEVLVHPSEDRLNLWVLAYGPYTAEEVQSLKTTNFKVTSMGNISFETINWPKVYAARHKVLIIAQPGVIDNEIAISKLKPTKVVTIMSDDGKTPRYKAMLLYNQD